MKRNKRQVNEYLNENKDSIIKLYQDGQQIKQSDEY